MTPTGATRVALALALAAASAACHAGPPDDATKVDQAVDVPGLDAGELTPRERRELSDYLTQLPSPCASVAVPIAQCLRESRPCPGCLSAAGTLRDAVREGLAPEQIEALYKRRFDPSGAHAIPVDGSPARGPESAPVTIVEFADFECPFCQRIAPDLDALVEKRPGQVRFVYKLMPLAMHPHGEIAARAAVAAQAQGRFWEMHHLLFAAGGRLEERDLESYAKAIGLDVDRFKADMKAPATQARLDADRKLADSLGVRGTPTLYINGREYDTKLDLDQWVDAEIASHK
jgi:protein-disulfide isomerase